MCNDLYTGSVAAVSVTVELHSPSTINDWPLSVTCTVEGWRQRSGGDITITDPGGRTNARFHSSNQTCSRSGFASSRDLDTRCDVDDQGNAILTLALSAQWFHMKTEKVSIGDWSCREEAIDHMSSNSFQIIGEALLVRNCYNINMFCFANLINVPIYHITHLKL